MMGNYNRAQRRAASNGNFGQAISGLANAVRDAKGKAEEQQEEPEHEASGVLPQPSYQIIRDNFIQWKWDKCPVGWSVQATYLKKDSSYRVDVWPHQVGDNDVYDSTAITGESAKALAECLLSAWQWEHTWRAHAGEYLEFDGYLVKQETSHHVVIVEEPNPPLVTTAEMDKATGHQRDDEGRRPALLWDEAAQQAQRDIPDSEPSKLPTHPGVDLGKEQP